MGRAEYLLKASFEEPIIVAHRGGKWGEDHSNIAAISHAVSAGFAVEIDIRIAKDGVPVVLHDNFSLLKSGFWPDVSTHSSEKLAARGIPSLEAVLNLTKDRVLTIIELKGGNGIVTQTLSIVTKMEMQEEVIFISFHPELLEEVMTVSSIPCVPLFQRMYAGDKEAEFVEAAEFSGYRGAGFQYNFLKYEAIREWHQKALPIFAYTVPPAEMDKVKRLGVNFLITDYPTGIDH